MRSRLIDHSLLPGVQLRAGAVISVEVLVTMTLLSALVLQIVAAVMRLVNFPVIVIRIVLLLGQLVPLLFVGVEQRGQVIVVPVFRNRVLRGPTVHEDRMIRGHVALPLVARYQPSIAQRVPQLRLFAGNAVDQQVDRLSRQQRRHHLAGQIGIVVGVVGRVDDQRQRREEEVNELGRVWIVYMSFQLGQQVERELELLEDVDELHLRRRLRSHRQHTVALVPLLRLPVTPASLKFLGRRCGVLQPRDKFLDVVETMVQDRHVAFVFLRGR